MGGFVPHAEDGVVAKNNSSPVRRETAVGTGIEELVTRLSRSFGPTVDPESYIHDDCHFVRLYAGVIRYGPASVSENAPIGTTDLKLLAPRPGSVGAIWDRWSAGTSSLRWWLRDQAVVDFFFFYCHARVS